MPKPTKSNFQRKASRKQQSHLVFHPVEAGSASGSSMSPARIRYADPTKKKPKASPMPALEDEEETDNTLTSDKAVSKDKKDIGKTLPTPRKSSQVSNNAMDSIEHVDPDPNDSNSDIVITSSRRLRSSTNEVGSQQSPLLRSSMRPNKSTMKLRGARKLIYSSDSSQGSEVEDESNKKKSALPNRSQSPEDIPHTYPEDYADDDSVEDSDLPIQPSTSKAKTSRKTPITTPRSFIAGGTSYNAPIASSGRRSSGSKPRASSSGRKVKGMSTTPSKSSKKVEPVESSSDESDENENTNMPTPKPTQSSSLRSKKISSSVFSSRRQPRNNVINVDSSDEDDIDPAPADNNEVEDNSDEDDEDDDDIVSSPLKRKRAMPAEDETDEDEENSVLTSPLKRRRLVRKGFNNDEDDEDEIVSSPSKRRRVVVNESDDSDDLEIIGSAVKKGKGKQKASSESGDQSSDDELPSLQKKQKKTSSQNKLEGRVTRKPRRTAVQKNLELLRRKRAGEDIDELTESEQEEQGRALYDSNSDLEVLSNFEDESEDDKVEAKKSRKKKKQGEMDEDDFVVEDDEEVGIPEFGLQDIPLQFTHAAHKRKKEHFKDAVEWMVQRKINPAFNRKDPVFTLAFRKLDDELRGHAMSNFASSVWREGFTRALFARPEFYEEHTGAGLDVKKCDACNRSKHPATFKISFGGKAYHKDTLEDVDNDPDSDEDVEDHQDVNENGERIPDEDQEFYVGSVCKGNAEMAHSLTHWKYALNEWVVDQLKSEGHLTPEKLAAREEMNTKKRSKIAEGIVDSWEASGQIKQLYSLLKVQLETATQGGPKKGRWN